MPTLIGPDPDLPEAFTLAEALASGLTIDQIRFRVESGRWETVGRGAYRRTDWASGEADRFERERREHEHRAIAAARRNPDSMIGYESASVVHRVPLWRPTPHLVTLIAPSTRWSGRRRTVVIRRLDVPPTDVTFVGAPITTPARTWVDIARTCPLADALAAGDAGLRAGIFTIADLRDSLERAAGARGHHRARLAIAYLDPVRETPGESASWAYFVNHAIKLPSCQVELHDRGGRFIGRPDFWWEGVRLVGEFDGRGKYGGSEDLYAEKRREDDLRNAGHRVIRWGSADLKSADLAQRLRAVVGDA